MSCFTCVEAGGFEWGAGAVQQAAGLTRALHAVSRSHHSLPHCSSYPTQHPSNRDRCVFTFRLHPDSWCSQWWSERLTGKTMLRSSHHIPAHENWQFLGAKHGCASQALTSFQSHSTLKWVRRYFRRTPHTFFSVVCPPPLYFSVELVISLIRGRQSFVPHTASPSLEFLEDM